MKFIKMLSLAGATALAAMAFVGASAASADSACLVDPIGGAQGECPAEKVWNGPIIGLSQEAIFDLDEKETKCKSEFLADWIKNEGKKIGALYLILTFTFTNPCVGACHAAFAENLPWSLLVLMAPGPSGQEHAILKEDGKGRPSILLEDCTILGLLLNCLYEFEPEILLNYALELKEKQPLVGAFEFNHALFRGGDDPLCQGFVAFQASYLTYEDKEKKEGGELFFTAFP